MKIGEAFVEVKADTKSAQKSIEQDLPNSAKKAAGAITAAFAGIAIAKFLSGAIDQASRLEQAVGATAAVFKSSSKVIDAFAKTSADSFGISEAAARELTSQIGGLLKGFGFTEDAAAKTSVQIAQLGADLAATFGGKPEEAVQALGAALRGETDPLERFGISLNQASVNLKAVELGLATSTSNVDQNAKAQATLALIYERSADAQGQFARESDTAAGAQARSAAKAEEASAKLGQQLLPIYTRLMETVGTLAEVFGSLPGPVQVAVVALAGLAALSPAIGSLVSTVKALGGALLTANPAWLAVAGAALAAVAIYSAVRGEKERLITATKDLAAALRNEEGALESAALSDFVATKFEKFAGALKGAGISYEQLTQTIATGKRPVGEAGEAFQKLIDDVDGFNLARNETRFALGELVKGMLDTAKAAGELSAEEEVLVEALIRTQSAAAGLSEVDIAANLERWREGTLSGQEAFSDLGAALDLVNQVAPQAGEAVAEVGAAARTAAPPVQRITELQQTLAGALGLSAEQADAFASAIDRVLSPAADAQAAYDAYLASIQAVDGALKENGKTLDAQTEKGRANREALRGIATDGLAAAAAMVANGQSNEEASAAIQSVRDNLIAQGKRFGLTQADAEAYADQLGLTPKNITTTVELARLEAEKARLSDWLSRLQNIPDNVRSDIQAQIDRGSVAEAERSINYATRPRQVQVTVRTDIAGGVRGGNGAAVRQERGGWTGGQHLDAGGFPNLGVPMLRVGEGGPENITDPFVLTAALTRKMDELNAKTGSGGVQQVNETIQVVVSGQVLAETVRRYERTQRGRATL